MFSKLVHWLLSYFGPRFDYIDSLVVEFDGIAYVPVNEGLSSIIEIVGSFFVFFTGFLGFAIVGGCVLLCLIEIIFVMIKFRRKKRISEASVSENK